MRYFYYAATLGYLGLTALNCHTAYVGFTLHSPFLAVFGVVAGAATAYLVYCNYNRAVADDTLRLVKLQEQFSQPDRSLTIYRESNGYDRL